MNQETPRGSRNRDRLKQFYASQVKICNSDFWYCRTLTMLSFLSAKSQIILKSLTKREKMQNWYGTLK